MNNRITKLSVFILSLFFTYSLWAVQGAVTIVRGDVTIISASGSERNPMIGMPVNSTDIIDTGKRGMITIRIGSSMVRVNEGVRKKMSKILYDHQQNRNNVASYLGKKDGGNNLPFAVTAGVRANTDGPPGSSADTTKPVEQNRKYAGQEYEKMLVTGSYDALQTRLNRELLHPQKDKVMLHSYLARTYAAKGNFNTASAEIKKANKDSNYKLNEEQRQYLNIARAEIEFLQGRFQHALDILQEQRATTAARLILPATWYLYFKSYYIMGFDITANEYYQELLRFYPMDVYTAKAAAEKQ